MFHVILGTPNDEMTSLRRYTAFNCLFFSRNTLIFPEVRLLLQDSFNVTVM